MPKLTFLHKAAFGLLVLWYSLIFLGVPDLLPNQKADLLGLEGLLEVFLIIISIAYLLKFRYADIIAILILASWGFLQYSSHWKSLLGFAVSREDIYWYNNNFKGTIRIFPESDAAIIPDAYHIILDILLAINLGIVAIRLFRLVFNNRKKTSV